MLQNNFRTYRKMKKMHWRSEQKALLLSYRSSKRQRLHLGPTMRARDLEELNLDKEATEELIGSVAKSTPTIRGLRVNIQGPLRPDDLSASDLVKMARDGEKMCRGNISVRVKQFIAPDHAWTIKTNDGNLVGFAKLSTERSVNAGSGWFLDLICSNRGGGMELFSKILTHYKENDADFLTLQPSDRETTHMYTAAATQLEIGWTKSGPDGLRVTTQAGRRVLIGDDAFTFWLRKSPWALRIMQNNGYRDL